MRILTEKQLAREAARLIREGKMPTLEEFTRVMVEIRREYRLKILRSRREAREKASKPIN